MLCISARAQWTPYMQQLLQKPNASSARAYLGIESVSEQLLPGSNVVFTADFKGRTIINASITGGTGTVTSFSAGDANPLFTTSVLNPTTTPALSFTLNYTPIPNTTTLTNQVYASNVVSGGTISTSVAGGLTNHNDVLASPNAGDVLIWSGSQWTNGPQAANAGVLSVTNAGIGQVSIITTSNPPNPSFKSVTAGANITITDNKTNIQFDATGGGGSGFTSYMQAETNYSATMRWNNGDVADGSVGNSAGNILEGFGDVLGFSAANSGTFVLTHRAASPSGLWTEMRTINSAGSIAALGSQTANAITPFTGCVLEWQTYLVVRNTNQVRIITGMMSANESSSDSIITNTIEFRYSTAAGDGTWKGVVCDGTNQTVVDTTVVPSPDTAYYLYFAKTNGAVTFTVNRANSTVANTHVPDFFNRIGDAMAAFYSVGTLDNNPKTNLWRYIGYTQYWIAK